MATFFITGSVTFPVLVRGAPISREIRVPFVLGGAVRRTITGAIVTPVVLGQTYRITGAIVTPVVLKGDIYGHLALGGGNGARATYDPVLEVPFVLSQANRISGGASGGGGSPIVPVAFGLGQTFKIEGTITTPVNVTGTVAPYGTTRSPALVHFDGTNFLKRSAGSGTGDNDLHGQAEFTQVVVFDPELVHVGQSCTVIAKDNGSTQRAWRVEWDATTGFVTVTVCASADGSNRSARTTAVALRKRAALAWTWDSTDLHLYVDGTLSEGSQTDTGTPGAMTTCTEPVSIGAHDPTGGGANPMKGAVYSVVVFHTALSGGDVAKIHADGSIAHDMLAGIKVWWKPDGIRSNYTNSLFYQWPDEKYALGLFQSFVTGGQIPQIIASDPVAPITRRNDWSLNFADTGIRPQNLTSTYVLSSTPPQRRLYNVANTIPNIAAGSNWRRFKNDVTLVFFGYKPAGTNNVVIFRCYGFELLYDRTTFTLFANVGVDTTLADLNTRYTFFIGTGTQLGDLQGCSVAIRYNASEDKVDCFVGATKFAGTTSATSAFSDAFGLTVSDQIDYIRAIAIPACVPDASLANLLSEVNGTAYSDEPVHDRYAPQGHAEGLAAIFPNYAVRFPTDPDPPAVLPTPVIEYFPNLAMLLPSVHYSDELGTQYQYVDDPYPVREAETIDDEDVAETIFGDPLPTIVSVTADPSHQVVAIANAGPTDAGAVLSWWEVELVSGNEETMVRIDYAANDFSTNRNHTDTFTIPLGLDFRNKRIRFVIQAVADGEQIWRSLFVRMENTDAFDNAPPETIIIPGPTTPSPPTISDLEVTIAARQLVLKRQSEARQLNLQVNANSRYKLTRPFVDSARDDGIEFDLMSVLEDFYTSGTSFRIHRVRARDIGFLDRVAVEFFGVGNEELWWAIAYANAIIDVETEMYVGQPLVIPSRDAVQQFLARRPLR